MKTIMVIAAVAAATVLVSLDAASARRVAHPYAARVPSQAYPGGYHRGGDPDPFIRGQIRRDIPLGSQGEGG